MAVNPILYAGLISKSKLLLESSGFILDLQLEYEAFKFRPEIELAYSLSTLCFGMSWFLEMFKLNLIVHTRVKECRTGIAGYLWWRDDAMDPAWADCLWKEYNPRQSVIEKSFWPQYDSHVSLVEWTCTSQQNYYSDDDHD